jgi:methionyl-tRNA formyltransferase
VSFKQRLLFLGPETSPLFEWLQQQGEDVLQTSEKIDPQYVEDRQIWFLISYGYRHIIKKEVLELFENRAINLHISFLPFNRGADPNLWSIVEGTQPGVTIHYLDEGIDTGAIIVQKRVEFDFKHDTLASSYQKLQLQIQQLFKENWTAIKNQKCPSIAQTGVGTCHKTSDRKTIEHLLIDGWNTKLSDLTNARKPQ